MTVPSVPPASEHHAPEHPAPERLRRGALGVVDIAASTMANIGPAMSFFFGFAFLASTAGVASPLTIVVAGIAIALLGNTLSQFCRALPSAGGFITYIGKGFGPRSAVTTALVAITGYIIAMASIIAISGGFLAIAVKRYAHVTIPWGILTLILTALAVAVMISGVAVSTKAAGLFFAFEMVVLVVVSVVVIIKHGAHLSLTPFEPKHINNGFSGLAAGFPLAIYMFIGWENSAALAEETDHPRRDVPRAVFTSIAVMVVSYLLFAYATVTGFDYNVDKLSQATVPFISVADGTLGVFAFFAYLAGLTSTLGALISGTNSQARLLFNAGREGLLARWIGRVDPVRRTPVNATFVYVAISLLVIGGWALGHVVGGSTGHLDAITFFSESGTMGTIPVLVVYLFTNLALPVYYRRHRREEFSALRHAVFPVLGAAVIVVPLYYLGKSGQAAPYSWFPWAALALVAVSALYAFYAVRRDPGLADRVGSILADDRAPAELAEPTGGPAPVPDPVIITSPAPTGEVL
ncbi:amino acid permease-associated region [Catenulispora acidiphila DSM 44928]|uniref:Amino acid permease-associated region n=1 Tax=Catenulispora acidiphila (strain DSM 44928 / JCM 14897 / NBRC 102108 / NRRL B-24433 / ID139908) TaxID=479433 RepID=C7PZ86_CATAD|nr:APC family permease [Catenulispora acidiphila]ACU71543.1 amino acid permease-associated region [Catenulispora acidiphila DSM 44928]